MKVVPPPPDETEPKATGEPERHTFSGHSIRVYPGCGCASAILLLCLFYWLISLLLRPMVIW